MKKGNFIYKTSRYFFLFLFMQGQTYVTSNEPVVAAYYQSSSQYRPGVENRPSFSPSLIDPHLLTDLYFAFAGFGYVSKSIDEKNPHFTDDFSIQPFNKNDQNVLYPAVMALKKLKGDLKICLSIGGWNFNDPNDLEGMGHQTYRLFSQMVSTASNRKQFIESSIAYAHRYGFDGIDIDWEYPGDLKRGGSEADFENFILFLKECSAAFASTKPPLILSYAAPPFVPSGLPQVYQETPEKYFQWLARCVEHLDRIHVMAYDYHGPFDIPKITGVNAPLNQDTNPQSFYYISNTLDNYLNNGVPAKKIVLGIPTFGHSFAGVNKLTPENEGPGNPFEYPGAPGPYTLEKGLLAYFEVSDKIATKKLIFGTDERTSTAYAFNRYSMQWVSFDTPDTIRLKALKALEKKLLGVVFWSVDMDEYHWPPRYPNLRSAQNVFYP